MKADELRKTEITEKQSRDTGLALVLLLLLISVRMKREWVLLAAIVLQVINMTIPRVYKPAAIIWFGLSHLLGTVMSKVLLSILFFCVVTPVGILRRLLGKDSLKLRGFRNGDQSAMTVRNHLFAGQDLEKPY